jgi:AbrB family looped-hinge helix DNA binding protein
MQTTRLSSKGQVILPKSVRDAQHWTQGTEFSIESVGDGVLLRSLKAVAHSRLEDVAGCLPVTGRARTTAEMDAAIVAEVRRRHDCGRY